MTWNIPGARTKNGRPHLVPLAPLAQEILASVRENCEGDKLHFLDHRRNLPGKWLVKDQKSYGSKNEDPRIGVYMICGEPQRPVWLKLVLPRILSKQH